MQMLPPPTQDPPAPIPTHETAVLFRSGDNEVIIFTAYGFSEQENTATRGVLSGRSNQSSVCLMKQFYELMGCFDADLPEEDLKKPFFWNDIMLKYEGYYILNAKVNQQWPPGYVLTARNTKYNCPPIRLDARN